MSAESIMALASATGATAELGGAFGTASAYAQQGKWQQETAEFNARMAGLQAADAIKRGEERVGSVRRAAAEAVGGARASFAAQGVDVSQGSAAAVQEDSYAAAEQDVQTVRANAWREAWGFNVEAENLLQQGRMARMEATNKADATLLTGGLRAASGYAQAGRDWMAGIKPKIVTDSRAAETQAYASAAKGRR